MIVLRCVITDLVFCDETFIGIFRRGLWCQHFVEVRDGAEMGEKFSALWFLWNIVVVVFVFVTLKKERETLVLP